MVNVNFIYALLIQCNYTQKMLISLQVDQRVLESIYSQALWSTSVDLLHLRASKFSVLKWIQIVILWVYYTIPFGFSLFRHIWVITFQLFG